MFCLSSLQDLSISVPCAHLPVQPHTKCSKGIFLAYMVPHLAVVVSIPACLCLLSLTQPQHLTWGCGCPWIVKVQGTAYGHSCESFTQQNPCLGACCSQDFNFMVFILLCFIKILPLAMTHPTVIHGNYQDNWNSRFCCKSLTPHSCIYHTWMKSVGLLQPSFKVRPDQAH